MEEGPGGADLVGAAEPGEGEAASPAAHDQGVPGRGGDSEEWQEKYVHPTGAMIHVPKGVQKHMRSHPEINHVVNGRRPSSTLPPTHATHLCPEPVQSGGTHTRTLPTQRDAARTPRYSRGS